MLFVPCPNCGTGLLIDENIPNLAIPCPRCGKSTKAPRVSPSVPTAPPEVGHAPPPPVVDRMSAAPRVAAPASPPPVRAAAATSEAPRVEPARVAPPPPAPVAAPVVARAAPPLPVPPRAVLEQPMPVPSPSPSPEVKPSAGSRLGSVASWFTKKTTPTIDEADESYEETISEDAAASDPVETQAKPHAIQSPVSSRFTRTKKRVEEEPDDDAEDVAPPVAAPEVMRAEKPKAKVAIEEIPVAAIFEEPEPRRPLQTKARPASPRAAEEFPDQLEYERAAMPAYLAWAQAHARAVAGGIIGVVGLLALLLILFFWQWRSAIGSLAEMSERVQREAGAKRDSESAVASANDMARRATAERQQADEAREAAERAIDTEKQARQEVEKSRAALDKQRLDIEQRLAQAQGKAAEYARKQARTLGQRGETAAGLLWLVRAWKLAPGDAATEQTIRTDVRAFANQLAPLRQLTKDEDLPVPSRLETGSRLTAVVGTDGVARVSELGTGKTFGPSTGFGTGVRCAAVSSDGKHVATGSQDGTARIWEISAGRAVGAVLRCNGSVNTIAFSPDGRWLATGSRSRFAPARLWSVPGGEPVGELSHEGEVVALAFSPDGKLLVTASADTTARLWSIPACVLVGSPLRHAVGLAGAAFTADGKTVQTRDRSGLAREWDITAVGGLVRQFPHQLPVRSLVFSNDGRSLFTGSLDGTAKLWEVDAGRLNATLPHPAPVECVALAPNGLIGATGCRDRGVRLWSLPEGKPMGAALQMPGPVSALAFDPKGKTILVASSDTEARLFEVASGKLLTTLRHPANVLAVALSSDGSHAATSCPGREESIHFWELPLGNQLTMPFPDHGGGARSLAYSADGSQIVATLGSEARRFEVSKGRPIGIPLASATGAALLTSSFSTNGRLMITGSADGVAQVWDTASGKAVGMPVSAGSEVAAAAISPDNATFVVGGANGTWLFKIPDAIAGSREQVDLWSQVLTGLELDESTDSLRVLGAEPWRDRLEKLRKQGGPLAP